MSIQDTLAIIPARGGSKGIPRKNIREVLGKPLISHTIEAALDCQRINGVIVSTDDETIADTARAAGAELPFIRPAELAEDDTPTEPVITHALQSLEEEYEQFILLQPTSPLRDSGHIREALARFEKFGLTSLVSVYPDHSYRWSTMDEGAVQVNFGGDRKRRQEKDEEFVENGAIYVAKVEQFLESECLFMGRTGLYEMRWRDSIDIDTPFDMWLAEEIMRYKQGRWPDE